MTVENHDDPESSDPGPTLDEWVEGDDAQALYSGETSPRNLGVATLLTFLNPGVGYAYVGRLAHGLLYNLVLVLLLAIALIGHAHYRFSPLLPALCFILGWAVLSALAALDVRAILAREGTEEYLLRPFNHWLPYVAIFTLSTLLPVYVTVDTALSRLWLIRPALHDGMFPTLLQGDLLLVDRRAIAEAPPAIGDIVSISADEPGAPVHHLRVVALAGDKVRVEDRALFIEDTPVSQLPAPEEVVAALPSHDAMQLMIEHNRDARYVISVAPGVVDNAAVALKSVPDGRIFLLGDNRSQVPAHDDPGSKMRDAREFDAQRLELLRGKPLFVLWSSDPDSGDIRWDRIGRRVQ